MGYMGRREAETGKLEVAFCSPSILTHPTIYSETARGSARMKRDLPECFRDTKKNFIVVTFVDASLPQRLQMLATFMWYASLHNYNIMVYWIESKTCQGEFSDGFHHFDFVSQEQFVLRDRLKLYIHVEFWAQGWDSWKPRVSQENCKGSFMGDDLLYTDFCVDKLREAIHYNMGNVIPPELSTRYERNEEDIYKAFVLNESLQAHANYWLSTVASENMTDYSDYCAVFLIDLDPQLVSNSRFFHADDWLNDTNFLDATCWCWDDLRQKKNSEDCTLVVLTEVSHIYYQLYETFEDKFSYGPFHEEGWKGQKGSKCITVEQQAMHYAVATQVPFLYSYKEMFGYRFLKHNVNSFIDTVEVPYELPTWILNYYSTRGKCMDKKMNLTYRGNRSQRITLNNLVCQNCVDLRGQFTRDFLGTLPAEAQTVLQAIDYKLPMGLFHKAVRELVEAHDNNMLDIQKLGQKVGTDNDLIPLKKNRDEYKAVQNKMGGGMPGWARAAVEGPYTKYCHQEHLATFFRKSDNLYAHYPQEISTTGAPMLKAWSKSSGPAAIVPKHASWISSTSSGSGKGGGEL